MPGTCQAPGLRPNFRQRTTRKHMNEPSRAAERQAADMAEDVSTMNLYNETSEGWKMIVKGTHSLNPDFGPPADGSVGRGLLGECVSGGKGSEESPPTPGMILLRRKETQAAINETTAAWTWSSARLPKMRAFRTDGMSRSPRLDAVPRRAERFISMFPLRLRMTGTIAINSLTRVIAFQCCPQRSVR